MRFRFIQAAMVRPSGEGRIVRLNGIVLPSAYVADFKVPELADNEAAATWAGKSVRVLLFHCLF
jgi:hypothetical protein